MLGLLFIDLLSLTSKMSNPEKPTKGKQEEHATLQKSSYKDEPVNAQSKKKQSLEVSNL